MEPNREWTWMGAAVALGLVSVAHAGDGGLQLEGWLAWRGPQQAGTSLETGLPERWSLGGENDLWSVPLPGRGTPVIAGGRVYVLGYEGEGETLLEVFACYD